MLYYLSNILGDWAILDIRKKNSKLNDRLEGIVLQTSDDSLWYVGEYSYAWAKKSCRKLSKVEAESFHNLGYYSPLKLAVDFDNTLFHTTLINFPMIFHQKLIHKIVASYVRYKKKKGWTIILNTLREKGKGLEEALEACKIYNIPIDLVNENLQVDIDKWGDSRKIACTLSIDDTQVGLIGFLLRKCR